MTQDQGTGGAGAPWRRREVGRAGQNYVTIVSDLGRGTVEYIADERRQASGRLLRALQRRAAGSRRGGRDGHVGTLSHSVRAHLDNADDKIVFDRFHVMGYLNKAVDAVRKQENPALVAQGDKTLSDPSTSGSTAPRTYPPSTRVVSPHCATATSRRVEPGRSRRACATSGSTCSEAGHCGTGTSGTSGPRTHVSLRLSMRHEHSSATSPVF